jgi:hypothetical protein
MSYQVDRNIPIPSLKRGHKYPWRQMQVGDSFLVRNRRDSDRAVRSARQYADYYQITFRTAIRTVTGGIRVWRTA